MPKKPPKRPPPLPKQEPKTLPPLVPLPAWAKAEVGNYEGAPFVAIFHNGVLKALAATSTVNMTAAYRTALEAPGVVYGVKDVKPEFIGLPSEGSYTCVWSIFPPLSEENLQIAEYFADGAI